MTKTISEGIRPWDEFPNWASGVRHDPNIVIGTFLLNDRYVSISFDAVLVGVSFRTNLYHYIMELQLLSIFHLPLNLPMAGVSKSKRVFSRCTSDFSNHFIDIDLLPINLGSFNITNGYTDSQWIKLCHSKNPWIPLHANEILTTEVEWSV